MYIVFRVATAAEEEDDDDDTVLESDCNEYVG